MSWHYITLSTLSAPPPSPQKLTRGPIDGVAVSRLTRQLSETVDGGGGFGSCSVVAGVGRVGSLVSVSLLNVSTSVETFVSKCLSTVHYIQLKIITRKPKAQTIGFPFFERKKPTLDSVQVCLCILHPLRPPSRCWPFRAISFLQYKSVARLIVSVQQQSLLARFSFI